MNWNYFRREKHYYLWVLLIIVQGPFEDLQTMHGHIYNIFKEACLALELLKYDKKWIECLQEASLFQT